MLSWQRRAALAVLLVGSAVVTAAACGSSASAGGFGGPGSDAGSPHDGGAFDGFTEAGAADGAGTDAGTDASTDAGPSITTVLFVHGSPSLPAVRLCWSVNGALAPIVPFPSGAPMPGTNFDGVPLGGVAALSNADALAKGSVQLYAIDAKILAGLERGETTPSTCDQLICGPGSNPPGKCLWQDHTYWVLGAPATLTAGTANLVAIEGCFAGFSGASTASCGSDWTTAGNLHADAVSLAAGGGASGGLVFQAVQLSPGLASLLGDAGTQALVGFGPQPGVDGGTEGGAATLVTLGGVPDVSLPTYVALPSTLAGYGTTGFSLAVPLGDAGVSQWMSLADSQQLVDPTQDPTLFFGQPRPYVVAIVGDPSAPPFGSTGETFDGTGLHILVVPTPLPVLPDAGAPIDAAAPDASPDAPPDAAGD